MHKKFEINQTKIKGCCQSGRKVVPQDSVSYLPLDALDYIFGIPRYAETFILSCNHNLSKVVFQETEHLEMICSNRGT